MNKKEQLKYINNDKNRKKRMEKECLRLWQEIVKARANYRCEFPGCRKDSCLNAHHVFSKGTHKQVKVDPDNGICLCSLHHALGKESAHKDPFFYEKILGEKEGYEAIRSRRWLNNLERKAWSFYKVDWNLEYIYLQQEYKKYVKDIANPGN
jgi:hypothetical protein